MPRAGISARAVQRGAQGLLKPAVVSVLGSRTLLAARLRQMAKSRRPTILNFHRVDDRGANLEDAMNPGVFEDLLRWLTNWFTVATFEELRAAASHDKPQLVLSFDDGYKDFVEVVAPILARHQVRANQNVIPACVDSGRPPRTVVVRDFISAAPRQLLREISVGQLPRIDPDNRSESGQRVATALKQLPIRDQDTVMAELELQFERFDGFRPTPVMSRKEVAQIASAHELGAHSHEHATMTSESDDYFRDDVQRCRQYFSSVFGVDPSVYAFPNGVARRSQIDMAHESGFADVLLTGECPTGAPTWLHSRRLVYGQSGSEVRFRALSAFAPEAGVL